MLSTVNVFLWCALSCANIKLGRIGDWLGPLLLMMYVINFMGCILINNYKSADKIFCHEEDKQRTIKSIPVTVIFIIVLLIGMGLLTAVFGIKGIENNTVPALKLAGMYILGTLTVTIGFFIENSNIKKWKPDETQYRINKISVGSVLACLIIYGLMCI